MKGWTWFGFFILLASRETNADIQSLTIPANVICPWAYCKGLCQSKPTDDSTSCSDMLDNYLLAESLCPKGTKNNYCIGLAASQILRCKLKEPYVCFPQHLDTETGRNYTEICWNSKSTCHDLSQFCTSNGYSNCSSDGYTTSNPPTTLSPDLSTRNQPIRTPDDLTSGSSVASSFDPPITTNASFMNPPITDGLESLKSLIFMISAVIGVLLIALILLVIFLLCVIRKHRKKKYGVPKRRGESFEMNEGAVYHAIGHELPPNHPTLGKGGTPSDRVNTARSYCSLDVTTETNYTEAENLQGRQNTSYCVLDRSDEQYQEGINEDNSRGTGSKYIESSTAYVDNQIYNSSFPKEGNHVKNGPDTTRVYTQLQRNEKEYSQVNGVSGKTNEIPTRDNSISDRPYMDLHVPDVDSSDVTALEREVERNESQDVITSDDFSKAAEEAVVKEGVKGNDMDVLKDRTSSDDLRVTELNKLNDTETKIKTVETINVSGSESPSSNFQQLGSTTFPRPKSLKEPSRGSPTPKKSKFLSLRFASKKRNKLSKKKLKSFCSADVNDFCLDLNISSPSSPPVEEKGESFLTAAVPIIHVPHKEPETVPEIVPEQLSKSQEAIFDDVNNEPFRNRSLSQPIRKTFSPTLCKEYEEIKESWGAKYLQVPPNDQK